MTSDALFSRSAARMTNMLRRTSLMALALFAPLAACDDSMSPRRDVLALAFTGLEPLAGGFHYEGWAITANGPVSTGKFDVGAGGALVTVGGATIAGGEFDTNIDLDAATAIVIT